MIEITEAGRQLAADLAMFEAVRRGHAVTWWAEDFNEGAWSPVLALARLATQSIADKAHTEAIEAQLAEAKADLERIYNLAEQEYGPWSADQSYTRTNGVYRIAAKHRVETDPLVEEARELLAKTREGEGAPSLARAHRNGEHDDSPIQAIVLAALKRGIELAVKS